MASLVSSSSTSSTNPVVPGSRISEGQQYLDWSIEKEREKGEKGFTQNVWSRFKSLEENFFLHKVKELVTVTVTVNQSAADKVQNLLNNHKKNLLVLSRQVEDTVSIVVGAGGIFAGQLGDPGLVNNETTVNGLKKLIRSTILIWTSKFIDTCKSDGFDHVCTKWRNVEGWQGSGRLAREVYLKEKAKIDDQLFVSIGLNIIPPEALECFYDLASGRELGPCSMWIQMRKRCHSGIASATYRNSKRKERGEKLVSILAGLKYTCLLENHQIVSLLSVYNEKTWQMKKEIVMGRVWQNIEVWPFVGFDTEGQGVWFQIGVYSPTGWECLVFGPAFFPKEMMELLESDRTVVTGRGIHGDLAWVLGRENGWRAVDLGAWTRDLPFHGHEENGLKRMFKETLGFDVIKIDQKHPKNREKFGYVRAGSWRNENLDSRQLVYMAGDVTLAGTVVFDIIVNLIEELGVAVLDSPFESLEEFVSPYFSRLVDRSINRKLQNPANAVPVESRSLVHNVAGVQLTVPVNVTEDIASELPEERREKYFQEIKKSGEEKMKSSGGTQWWQKRPELRMKKGEAYPEKIEEEYWDSS